MIKCIRYTLSLAVQKLACQHVVPQFVRMSTSLCVWRANANVYIKTLASSRVTSGGETGSRRYINLCLTLGQRSSRIWAHDEPRHFEDEFGSGAAAAPSHFVRHQRLFHAIHQFVRRRQSAPVHLFEQQHGHLLPPRQEPKIRPLRS